MEQLSSTKYDSRENTQLTAEQLLDAGQEFLQHFGVEASPSEQPDNFRQAIQQLDPRYQGGRELVRWELEADQTEWDEETKNIIMRTAENMRMLEGETPLRGNFDVVIVLGGARQSNLDRTKYAVDALSSGKAQARRLVVVGTSRELNEAEQEHTTNYAPGAETEFDLCVGAAAMAAKENPGQITSVQYVEDNKAGTPVVIEQVLSTLQENGDLPEGASVAAITTQIYQASTERDLDRISQKFGVSETFTAGNPSDPNVVAKRKPATYLSEILRTLRAAVNDVEARQTQPSPSEVIARAKRVRRDLDSANRRSHELHQALMDIDRQNPKLAETIRNSDGSVLVREVSGSEWYSYKNGKSYSDEWCWNNDIYTED